MTLLFCGGLFIAKNLKYFFLLAVRKGANPGGHVCGGKVRGKPGQALFQASVVNADLAGQQFDKVTGIIPIGRQAALREQADLLDGQVVDFNVRAEQK